MGRKTDTRQLFGLLAVSVFCHRASAQRLPARPTVTSTASLPASVAGVLTGAASRAGVIFAGTVLAMDRQDASGFVDVRFHVDNALRGCGNGDTYVLREWAGLWSGQAPRYVPGERLLMLLAPRGRSGMSAPVDGPAGAIPLVASAQPPLRNAAGLLAADTGQRLPALAVDLRWIETMAMRSTSPPPLPPAEGRAEWHGPVEPLAATSRSFAPRAQGVSLQAVLALLRKEQSAPIPVEQ